MARVYFPQQASLRLSGSVQQQCIPRAAALAVLRKIPLPRGRTRDTLLNVGHLKNFILCASLVAIPWLTWAESYTFTTIDVPGARGSDATGLNDAGQIVGSFWDDLSIHAFLRSSDVTITTFDVPGAYHSTVANAINDVGRSQVGSTRVWRRMVATPGGSDRPPLPDQTSPRPSSGRGPG